jgi:hypothetical protein
MKWPFFRTAISASQNRNFKLTLKLWVKTAVKMTVKNGSFEAASTVAMRTIQSVNSSSTLVLIFGCSREKEVFIYWGWVQPS